MATEGEVQEGHGLLARISNELVRAQKDYFGRGPVKAKSYMLDDMLFVVLRGGMTVAEKTMLDFDQPDLVRQFRQAFENKMSGRLCALVEELTGRKILGYQSQIMFEPDLVVEMFVFDDEGGGPERAATAEDQLTTGDGDMAAEALEDEMESGPEPPELRGPPAEHP